MLAELQVRDFGSADAFPNRCVKLTRRCFPNRVNQFFYDSINFSSRVLCTFYTTDDKVHSIEVIRPGIREVPGSNPDEASLKNFRLEQFFLSQFNL